VPGDWAGDTYGYLRPGLAGIDWSLKPFPKGSRPLAFFTNHVVSPLTVADQAAPGVYLVGQTTDDSVTFRVRNSDCVKGSTVPYGFAVAENATVVEQRDMHFSFGRVGPAAFSPSCVPGDWKSWTVAVDESKYEHAQASVVTATSYGVPAPLHASPAVGLFGPLPVESDPPTYLFNYRARNSDTAGGFCGLNYLYITPGISESDKDLFVDSGTVPPKLFLPSGVIGDWSSPWTVKFGGTFAEPPMVFVTASSRGVKGLAVAVVGMVGEVTTTGFTLHGRNSDCAAGMAGFNWVAFGKVKK
jgi:hypothetical protein